MKVFAAFLLINLLTACTHLGEYSNAYDQALEAEWASNYEQSMIKYKEAYDLAIADNAHEHYISAALYGYGRMLGYTCNFNMAEEILKESLAIQTKIGYPTLPEKNTYMAKRLSELGRLNLAQKDFAEAARYFRLALEKLKWLSFEDEDPIGYANYLKDYAYALEKIGNIEQAEYQKQRINELENKYDKAKALHIYRSYNDVCAK